MGLSLKEISGKIQKKFGEEAISGTQKNVRFLSTGVLSVDIAGGGGIPFGRIIEVYGAEASGKTTFALTLAHAVQQYGKAVGYVDVEQSLDVEYAKNLGVDMEEDKWILSQPGTAEEALDIVKIMTETNEIGLIVVDSVASLVPKAIIQGEVGDVKIGLSARLLSAQVPTFLKDSRLNDCIILFINQIRDNIGVMYGSKTTTPGGKALPFYASQRIEVARCGFEKDGDTIVGSRTKLTFKKNKVSSPYKTAEFLIRFGKGIDKERDVIDQAVLYEVIKKSGSWFSYNGLKIGQGIDNVSKYMMEHPDVFEQIKKDTIGIIESKNKKDEAN